MTIEKKEKGLCFLLGSGLFTYLVLRAIYVPLAHDELLTFFTYIQPGDFLPYESFWDTNNHFFNTFLSWGSYQLFGSSQLSLRLPNLLGSLLYLWFSYRLFIQIKFTPLRIGLALALWLSAYFIEFFSMNRGYGLSMGLMITAIFMAHRALVSGEIKYYLMATISMILALSANLTLMITTIVLLVFISVYAIVKFIGSKQSSYILKGFIPLLLGCWPVYYWICYGFALKERGLLYYGRSSGFWDTTVDSLIVTMFEKFPIPYEFLVVFPLLGLAIAIFFWFKSHKNVAFANLLAQPGFLFACLLFGNIIATMLLAKFVAVLYPADRGALYYIPLFLLTSAFLLDECGKQKILSWLMLPILFLPIHFLTTMNLSHSSFWQKEHMPEAFFKLVENDVKEAYMPTITGRFTNQLYWDYLNLRNSGNLPRINENPESAAYADYIINGPYFVEDSVLLQDQFDTLLYDPITSYMLLKRHRFYERRSINKHHITFNNFKEDPQTYFTLWEDSVWHKQALYFQFELNLWGADKAFSVPLIFSSIDFNDKNAVYKKIELSGYAGTFINNHQFKMTNNLLAHPSARPVFKNSCYIWNEHQLKYAIKGEISVFELYR